MILSKLKTLFQFSKPSRHATGQSPWTVDTLIGAIAQILAMISGLILLGMILFLIQESLPLLNQISLWQFLSHARWQPLDGKYGVLALLIGSLLVTLISLLVSVPLGIASALFCHDYAPSWLANLHRRILQLLAGIPSVVFGFWGLVTLVPLINHWQPPGASLLAGSLILALMILPTIALVADSAIAQVPLSYRHTAASLGLGRWATLRGAVLPSAKSGILMGIVLGAGRAIGETMAVLMVSGNVVQIPQSLFDSMRTLTANIALEMAYATDTHRGALFVSGLLLSLMIAGFMVMLAIARQQEVLRHGR